jgi:hypothetical protein
MKALPASGVYALLADCATLEIGPTIASDFDAVWQMHRAMPPPHRRQIAGGQQVTRNRGQFPPSRPPSKCSTSRSATWRSSAPQHRDPQLGAETGAPGVHHLLRRANLNPMKPPRSLTQAIGRSRHTSRVARGARTECEKVSKGPLSGA